MDNTSLLPRSSPCRDGFSALSGEAPGHQLFPFPGEEGLRLFQPPLLLVVEGLHDIAFLKGVARMLHEHDSSSPDLSRLEAEGWLVFIPIGGGNLNHWTIRLANLGHWECHIYDREVPPLTAERLQVIDALNQRPGCVAYLTHQRAMENNLHPAAIYEATGMAIDSDATTDVPERLARQFLLARGGPTWEEIPRRSRRRLRQGAKGLLNTVVVAKMTPERLAEQDPYGEVRGWLTTIHHLSDPPDR